jgi:N-acetylmuramoyl-L-alanine amidase
MRIVILALMACSIAVLATAQKPALSIKRPDGNTVRVSRTKNFIEGLTCKTCQLFINENPVKVQNTGAFAAMVELQKDSTIVVIKASNEKGDTTKRQLTYLYTKPKGDSTIKQFAIANVETQPEGNLLLMPGDKIRIKVKAQPGNQVVLANNFRLSEQKQNGIAGYYVGEYRVKPGDELINGSQLAITLKGSNNSSFVANTKHKFSMMPDGEALLGRTVGKLPALLEGLGEDRLGGPKMGYLDTGVVLKIIGKVGNKFKVQLSGNLNAYIDDDFVDLQPVGSIATESLTGSIKLWGDEQNEYAVIPLSSKLPYRSFQRVSPSKVVLDVFGAISNTNWIVQPDTLKEIKNITYESLNDQTFRIVIDLAHQQHWGHSIYYVGNNLYLRIKKQPASLALKDLVIGIDAGHGGSNDGASGIAGTLEKNMTLAVVQELRTVLNEEDAQLVLTRVTDESFENKERLLFFNRKKVDIVISIHLNSADNSVDVKGTSTYYKHIGFRPLTMAIYKRLLSLGLKGFGNIGNFNFILNSQTDQPNCLVETVFVSNPEDEAKILDPNFRKEMARKIVQGLKDWLAACQ